jgi:hypothetical protein
MKKAKIVFEISKKILHLHLNKIIGLLPKF